MQVKVESVSDVKVGQYGPSSKIKCGNASYFVNEDATPLVGKTLEITTEQKTSAKGNQYTIAKIVKVLDSAAPAQSNGNGQPWALWRQMAGEAHKVAMELEPDTNNAGHEGADGSFVDRSTARAAILNTIMIAFSNGKITLTQEDTEEIPF